MTTNDIIREFFNRTSFFRVEQRVQNEVFLREKIDALLEGAAVKVEKAELADEKMPAYAAFQVSAHIIRSLQSKKV